MPRWRKQLTDAANNLFVDTDQLPVIERRPGWRGRLFDSPSMSFAHYDFDAGSSIHEHFHPQEEVWQVIEGELEITVGGVSRKLRTWLRRHRSAECASFRESNLEREGYHRGLSAS